MNTGHFGDLGIDEEDLEILIENGKSSFYENLNTKS